MSGLNHIGSKISLVSKAEIRYEGILYALDVPQQTISLAKVRSYGTEDRPTERPIPSKEEVYEFIIFRGTDIKNIDVLESPKQGSVLACGLPQDPAIIEVSHHRSSMAPFNCGFEPSGRYPGPRGGRGDEPFEGLLMGPRGRRYFQENGNQSDRRRNGNNNGPGRNYVNSRNNVDAGRRSRQDNVYRGGGGGGPRGGRGNSPNRDRGQGNMNGQGRDGSRGSSGNRVPNRQRGIIQAQMPPRVTFDDPFDFEKSNEELKTAMEKLKLKEEEGDKKEGEEAGENKEEKKEDPVIYYDKDKFFDNISCEALERARGGRQPRQDWRAERKLNAETFGLVWKPNQMNYQRNGQRNYNRPRMDHGGYRGGNNPIRYNNRYNNRS